MVTAITAMTISTMMTMAITTTITTTIPMLMTTNRAAFDGHGGVDGAEAAALYRLLTWLSPSFPVGAFSYSSGIEWAVEAGDIVDAPSLQDWLACMLTDGPGFCDGVLLAHAHRAASSSSHAGLREVAELAAAFVPSRERQLETSAQGRAFVDIARAAWNCEGLDQMVSSCDGAIVYPVAVGLVSAAHWHPPRAGDAGVPARHDVELDIRRRAPGSAGADRQPARARPSRTGGRRHGRPGARGVA